MGRDGRAGQFLRTWREDETCKALMSAALLLVLDLALIVPITMMAVLEKSVSMGLIPAIAMAAYTT